MKILATTTVRRDDQTSALASLVGAYDDYRAKPQQPTGGTITVKGTPHATLAISATSEAGNMVWTGIMTLNTAMGKTTATYEHKQDAGKGTLELEQAGDEIMVTGRNNAPQQNLFT